MIDSNMCTDVCPCYHHEDNNVDFKLAWQGYATINSDYFAYRGRKWSSSSGSADDGLRPFVWTKDEDKGFSSFEHCFESWLAKAQGNSSIDLKTVFDVTDQEIH